MKTNKALAVLLTAFYFLSASCEKKEEPHPFPPQGDATADMISIGEDYETQVYYSFESGVVDTSANASWDFSFSNWAGSSEIWVNGGCLVYIKPTGEHDLSKVNDSASFKSIPWKYDDPSGLDGTSALGNLITNNHIDEVLLINKQQIISGRRVASIFKLKITQINDESVSFSIDTVNGSAAQNITLAKDPNFNYTFYSLSNGVVTPEPPKDQWDIVFTRYQHIYRNYNGDGIDLLYQVNGVLLNPYQTKAADDSTKDYNFAEFALDQATSFTFFPNRDLIGFDWKVANIDNGSYIVKPNKIFLVTTQNDALYKLHFTGFYSNGKKGYPQFEYKRLQ